jgi:hypothetical protein
MPTNLYRAENLQYGPYSVWIARYNFNTNKFDPFERLGFVNGSFEANVDTFETVPFKAGLPLTKVAIVYREVGFNGTLRIGEINPKNLSRLLWNQPLTKINTSTISRTENFSSETAFFALLRNDPDYFNGKKYYILKYHPADNVVFEYSTDDGSTWDSVPTSDYQIETYAGITCITTSAANPAATTIDDTAQLRITYNQVILEREYFELISDAGRLGQMYKVLAIQHSQLNPNKWNYILLKKAQIKSINRMASFTLDEYGSVEVVFETLADYPENTPEIFAKAGLATLEIGQINFTETSSPLNNEKMIVGQLEQEY